MILVRAGQGRSIKSAMGNDMTKTIFIIPGFKQKPRDKCFQWLENFLRQKGFNVVRISIIWDHHTMSDYVAEFKKQYNSHRTGNDYVLGFSYGAVVALISANELRPKKIYLCSLSSDFKEDIGAMKPWIRKLVGKKRIGDMKKRSGREFAKNLAVPSVIFYGETEGKKYPQLKIRCEETAKYSKRSKLVIVDNAPHKIDYPAYTKAIKDEFKSLRVS